MNGDQQYMEILQGQARIEAIQNEIIKKMDDMCKFKDFAQRQFQNYDDYKETRKQVIPDIQALKDLTARCNQECNHRKSVMEERRKEDDAYHKKTDYLMVWSYKISGIQIVISFLAALVVVLVQLKILKPW
jgi:hypothetical protein